MRHARLRSVEGLPHGPRGRLWRRFARTLQFGLVGTILLIGGASTEAQTVAALPDASALEEGAPARPVAAWTAFCARMPAECAVDTTQPAVIALTPRIRDLLNRVNRRVNARIKPITDLAHWGVVDRWDYPDDGFGDC